MAADLLPFARSPNRALRFASGFTLIEILVVLILIGITVGLATLSVGSAGARQAEQEAQRLAALIGLASDEAVLKSEEIGIRFRPDGYEFMVLAPDNTWQPPGEAGKDDVLRPRTLPAGFMLAAAVDGLVIQFDKPKDPKTIAPHAFLLSSGERSAIDVELGPIGGVHYRLQVPVVGKLTIIPIEPQAQKR